MEPEVIIENYVNDVAAHLPRKVRNDIGFELRTLLAEQLAAAAADSGHAADAALAIEVVRGFGAPFEVAARYSPPGLQIIEPRYASAFMKLSVACVVVQWALTLPAVFESRTTFAQWWLGWGFGAFAWVGWLVIWFGIAAWARRRATVDPEHPTQPWWSFLLWLPVSEEVPRSILVDHANVQRRAELGALPLGVVLTIFFTAPIWFISLMTPAGTDTAWAAYDPHFRQVLLPVLLALMVLRLALCATAGFNARLRTRLEPIRTVLWVLFVGLLYWTIFASRLFSSPITDALFRAWVFVYLIVNTVQIGLRLYSTYMRVSVPKTLA